MGYLREKKKGGQKSKTGESAVTGWEKNLHENFR